MGQNISSDPLKDFRDIPFTIAFAAGGSAHLWAALEVVFLAIAGREALVR